uniref:hypothetical protein n=1 Tax=Streptomyces achromogenes TaxID=67255 RepID=UPI003F494A94
MTGLVATVLLTAGGKASPMTWSLPEPMLTVAVDSPALPAGWATEPKWDGSPDIQMCFI